MIRCCCCSIDVEFCSFWLDIALRSRTAHARTVASGDSGDRQRARATIDQRQNALEYRLTFCSRHNYILHRCLVVRFSDGGDVALVGLHCREHVAVTDASVVIAVDGDFDFDGIIDAVRAIRHSESVDVANGVVVALAAADRRNDDYDDGRRSDVDVDAITNTSGTVVRVDVDVCHVVRVVVAVDSASFAGDGIAQRWLVARCDQSSCCLFMF
jgi:hypothetical protein